MAVVIAPFIFQNASGQKFYFDRITIENGLSHNTVNCILQDAYGYVWIGTQNGLNKYDGYNFTVYKTNLFEDVDGFIGNEITALFEDSKGNLWVGTRKAGLNVKSKGSNLFENKTQNKEFDKIKGFEITRFYEDNEANLWICTKGAGLIRYNPSINNSQQFTDTKSNLSNNIVFDIVQDADDKIWIACGGGGINVMQPDSSFSLSHPISYESTNFSGYRKRLFIDDNNLWVATEGTGLYCINTLDYSFRHWSMEKPQHSISSNVIIDIAKNHKNQLLIANNGEGLDILNIETNAIENYRSRINEDHSLSTNALTCFYIDKNENIWIGTFNGGINIYKPNKTWFRNYKTPLHNENIASKSVLGIDQINDSIIWVGTDGGGISVFSNQSHLIKHLFLHDKDDNKSIAGNVVKSIFKDSNGNIWIGYYGSGLDKYDPKKQEFEHIITNGLSIWGIDETADGKIWLATLADGVVCYSPKTKELTNMQLSCGEDQNKGSYNCDVMDVFVDSKNQIWVATVSNGLAKWNESLADFDFYQYDKDDTLSISSNEIRSIYVAQSGEIWIGTENSGLNKWNTDGTFNRFGTKNGLLSNSVVAITEDENGFIWVSSYEGLSSINPKDYSIKTNQFRDNNRINQFNQNSILTDQKGEMYFGGINGLHVIKPIETTVSESIVLTRLEIFNKNIDQHTFTDEKKIVSKPLEEIDTLTFNYDDDVITFHFSSFDFGVSAKANFEFKLQDIDDKWRLATNGKNRITYTNIASGSHKFLIRKGLAQKELLIIVTPPFWETELFRVASVLLIFLFFIGIAILFVRRRENILNEKMLSLKNENLALELEGKNSKLLFSSAQMAQKNELISQLKNDLINSQYEDKPQLPKIIRKLDQELKNEDYWKELDIYFNQVDKKFVQSFTATHTTLTQNDLRICSLIRLNLSTKEIASLLNVTSRAVEQSKYRLKKRIGLEKEVDLAQYIINFKNEG